MVNRLVHNVSVESRWTASTVAELLEAIKGTSSGCEDELDKEYTIELLREELSDGSAKYSVSIYSKEG